MTSPEDGSPAAAGSGAESATNPSADQADQPTDAAPAPATTELPAVDWTPPAAGAYQPPSNEQPADDSAPSSSWTSDETRNFPAYQPQSYPTYPPNHSPTTEIPAVTADGPPPSSAAAYPTPNASAYGASPSGTTKPARRGGAGFAGAVGLIGLSAAGAGAFALPVQLFTNSQNTYFGTYRDLAAHKLTSSGANDHSISIVGGHLATDWWRYGVFGALGGLAFLFLVQICVPVLRRLAGVLLFLGGLAAAAGFLVGAHQTNDYSSVSRGASLHRISWQHLAYGFWIAVAGCVVIALGGLIAASQSTRR